MSMHRGGEPSRPPGSKPRCAFGREQAGRKAVVWHVAQPQPVYPLAPPHAVDRTRGGGRGNGFFAEPAVARAHDRFDRRADSSRGFRLGDGPQLRRGRVLARRRTACKQQATSNKAGPWLRSHCCKDDQRSAMLSAAVRSGAVASRQSRKPASGESSSPPCDRRGRRPAVESQGKPQRTGSCRANHLPGGS